MEERGGGQNRDTAFLSPLFFRFSRVTSFEKTTPSENRVRARPPRRGRAPSEKKARVFIAHTRPKVGRASLFVFFSLPPPRAAATTQHPCAPTTPSPAESRPAPAHRVHGGRAAGRSAWRLCWPPRSRSTLAGDADVVAAAVARFGVHERVARVGEWRWGEGVKGRRRRGAPKADADGRPATPLAPRGGGSRRRPVGCRHAPLGRARRPSRPGGDGRQGATGARRGWRRGGRPEKGRPS
jgi:hypothetical protein